MIDLRRLSYFLCACEHENLGMASEQLGVAPSTLTESLKALELELGVTLLRKRKSDVSPEPAARWLHGAGLPLLLLDQFGSSRLAAPATAEATLLHLTVGLHFAFGRVSKAITRAIALTSQEEPLVLVYPEWISESVPKLRHETARELRIGSVSQLTLNAVPRAATSDEGEIAVLSDGWLLLRRHEAPDHAAPYGSYGSPRDLAIPTP